MILGPSISRICQGNVSAQIVANILKKKEKKFIRFITRWDTHNWFNQLNKYAVCSTVGCGHTQLETTLYDQQIKQNTLHSAHDEEKKMWSMKRRARARIDAK